MGERVFCTATELTSKSNEVQVNMLLYAVGAEYETFYDHSKSPKMTKRFTKS